MHAASVAALAALALPRSRSLDLLHHPAVAVRVGEGKKGTVVSALRIEPGGLTARAEVKNLADFRTALDELRPSCLDVGDDEVESLHGAGLRARYPGPDRDRAGRAQWGQLDHAKSITGTVIHIEPEARLLDVEVLRPVDVGHGDDDELKLPDAGSSLAVSRGACST